MGKSVEKPAENGAPAYMTMYTSLMMLLLAFFIALISMATSNTKSAGLQPGIGSIKNSFGMQGGLGLMPYIKMVRNLRNVYPKTDSKPETAEPDRNLLGHPQSTLREDMIIDDGFLNIEPLYRGISLRVNTPIVFATGSAALDQDARAFLQRMGGILNSFPEGILTVRVYTTETGQKDRDELLAAERAAAIVRYMRQQSAIAPERLQAVGYSSQRYFQRIAAGQDQQVLFFINKKIDRTQLITPATAGINTSKEL